MNRRLAARATAAAALAAGLITALAVPATSDPDPAPEPAPKAGTAFDALQRDLGLTAEQAHHRLDLEAVARRADAALRGVLRESFGGAHYDSGLGKLVVGVTDPGEFDAVRAEGAEPRLVEFSTRELDSVQRGLSEAPAPEAVSGSYVESRSDSVVVTTAPGTARQAERFVRESGVDAKAVRVVESPESPRPLAEPAADPATGPAAEPAPEVAGGDPYETTRSQRCSVGFAVDGGFLSAGHCGRKGDATTKLGGTFAASSFPASDRTPNDYSYVQVTDSIPRPRVNTYDGGSVPVAGSAEAVEGASVCRSGSTTGWQCGTVQAKNQSVRYPKGTVEGLTRTDACSEAGDSGGPFLAGDQAQGMTSGSSGNCSTGGTTYFQPVNEVLGKVGVDLLTTP